MTYEETKALQDHREQRTHEMKLAVLSAFAADPELKYYAGVAVGAGVAAISSLFADIATSEEDKAERKKKGDDNWKWLLYAAVPASALAEVVPGWVGYFSPVVALGQSAQESPPAGSPTDLAKNVVAMSAVGFAGFCASILILKAMFGGESGKGSISTLTKVV